MPFESDDEELTVSVEASDLQKARLVAPLSYY
jgi:hypothetical protein